MSLLREIMQKFGRQGARSAPATTSSNDPSTTPATDLAYAEQLESCSDDELLYEWAWLERRLEALALASGADARAQRQEAISWRRELVKALEQRALSPVPLRGPVDPACHAWEVSEEATRLAWRLGRGQGTRLS
jgi:hypothetical protein